MSLKKKIAALAMAAVTAISSVAVTAFAPLTSVTAFAAENDVPGTNATKITNGKQVMDQIKYVNTNDYAGGNNYKEYLFTAPCDGVLTLDLQAYINNLYIDVIDQANLESHNNIQNTSVYHSGGYRSSYYSDQNGYYWDSSKSVFSVTQKYDLKKGNYYIRIRRFFDGYADGTKGSGQIKLTCTMETPKAPGGIKLSSSTTSSLSLDWDDVVYGYTGGAPYYPTYTVGYKVKGSQDAWKYVNTKFSEVTLSKLKVNTTYTVAIRSNQSSLKSSYKYVYPKTKNYTAPANVGTVKASSITTSGAKLSWTKAKNATRYLVRYKVKGTSTYTNKWVTSPSITLSGLKKATNYVVFVKAYNHTVPAASWSKALYFKTQGTLTLAKPTLPSKVTVYWNKVTNATGYDVQFTTNGGKTWTTKAFTKTNITFSGTKGAKITYRVRATAGSTKGAYSANKTIILP